MRSVLLLAAIGCGDNVIPDGVPLVQTADVAIVAHQDDDLLFMQPDLLEATARGGVTTVYVTAGDDGRGLDAAEPRYNGALAAYSAAAGNTDWACGWIELAGHAAEHCRLEAANVSLVFLGYPDGGYYAEHGVGLSHLWRGEIASVETIARRPARYDRPGLIATLAEVLDATAPRIVRTLEIAQTHGRDHPDHRAAGALALLAVAASHGNPEVISYRGYNTDMEPENLLEPVFARSADALAHYDACATDCPASCGGECPSISESHAIALHRRYATSMRRRAAGLLRGDTGCVVAGADGALGLAECADPDTASWRLAADGTLRTDDRCLEAAPSGELRASSCAADAAHRVFLDEEGRIWFGIAPTTDDPVEIDALLRCLVADGGVPHAAVCGASGAPVWQLSPTPTAAPHPFPGLPGRALQLADLTGDGRADLCTFDAGGLRCAPGRGDGTFDAALRIDSPAAPLAIEPESLALGDVDGDGRADACGRDSTGLSCALAATQFAAEPWSAAFARTGPADATDRSLAIAAGELCALAPNGVACAVRGAPASLHSAWPPPATVVWPGDLDGDRRPDWCAATPSGAACSVDTERELTTDGAPWSYARYTVVDPAPTDAATGALADVDGDGRADLCSIRDGRILCAFSQGRGFGPLVSFATLPAPATALWLGDLDGDGTADACVDAGAQIVCVR